MELTPDSLRELIVSTIHKNAEPDRAGNTPVSRLVDSFGGYDEEEVRATTIAIADLVRNPPEEDRSNREYWMNLGFIAGYVKASGLNEIRIACRDLLYEGPAVDHPCALFIMNIYIGAGGQVVEEDLMGRFAFVRERSPLVWLNAAVRSGHFSLVEETTIGLLEKGVITIQNNLLNFLVLHFDSWKSRWPEPADFFDVVRRFRDATPASDGRECIDKWLEFRLKKA